MWLPILAFAALVLYGAVWQVQQGQFPLYGALFFGVIALILVFVRLNPADRQIGRLLQSPTSAPLVSFYERNLSRGLIADRDALLAYSVGLAHTLYGEFDAARQALGGIAWDRKPPLMQATRWHLEALLLQRVVVAWGLKTAYMRAGRQDDARAMRVLLTNLAPHCRGLAPRAGQR